MSAPEDSFSVQPAGRDDFTRVADLHIEGIPSGFLSTLGRLFLSELYRGIAGAPQSMVLVAQAPRPEIVGFVCATADTSAMYRTVMRRHWPALLLRFATRSLSPAVVAKGFQTVLYGLKPRRNAGHTAPPPRAELLAIAVDRRVRGKGIGRRLVKEMERNFREMAVRSYQVVTAAGGTPANALYAACGFSLHSTFSHHCVKMNRYVKGAGSES